MGEDFHTWTSAGPKEIEKNAKFLLEISELFQLEGSLRTHGPQKKNTSLRLYTGFLEADFGFLRNICLDIVLFLLFGTAVCVSLNPLMPD